jgi:hypothetical protein
MRIFLHANILFSAAQMDGQMRKLLNFLFNRTECLTNEYAIQEAGRNLAVKVPPALESFEQLVMKCEIVLPLQTAFEIDLPLKDLPIFGGAIAGHATHLLTGDHRDFGKFWGKTIQGVKIVSPQLLTEELQLGKDCDHG